MYRRLKRALWWLVPIVVAVTSAALIAEQRYATLRREASRQWIRDLGGSAELTREAVSAWLDDRRIDAGEAAFAAEAPGGAVADMPEIRRRLEQLLQRRGYAAAWIVRADGSVLDERCRQLRAQGSWSGN